MVPRSRSLLKGSWECLWKHLLQLCQLEPLLHERLESWGVQGQTRRQGSAGRQMLYVTIRQTEMSKLSTSNTCHLVYFNYTSIKLEEKNRQPLFYHLKSVLLPNGFGKAGFNKKIQLGSKLKENQSMQSERRRFSQASQCREAHEGTLKTDL